jgi:hypothetical protein
MGAIRLRVRLVKRLELGQGETAEVHISTSLTEACGTPFTDHNARTAG